MTDGSTRKECGFCHGSEVTEDCYKLVCLACGTIMEDILFEAGMQVSGMALSAKRMLGDDLALGNNDTTPNVSDDVYDHESSGGTIIRMLPSGPRPMMRRVQEKHVWSQSSHRERTTFQLLSEMTCNMSSSATLVQGCVIEDAKRLYIECNRVNLRGKKNAKLAACVYVALQNNGTPKPCNEVSDMFGVVPKDVARTIKKIINTRVNDVLVGNAHAVAEHMSVSQLLNKTCSVLGLLDEKQKERYHVVLQRMQASAQFNCTPSTLVGACLCFCEKDASIKKFEESVASFLSISVSTIHKYVKMIRKVIDGESL